MWIIAIVLWLVIFKLDTGTDVLYSMRGGGGGDSDEPAAQRIDPAAEARANVAAQVESIPRAAQLQYDVLTNPEYGITPTTQAYESARGTVFPEQTNVRNQLVQNILQQLTSPTGYTPEQQQALDTRRGEAVTEAERSQRTRANLGGNLYGGRAQAAEQRDINQLQNQFATEDIEFQERQRLNTSQLALSIMQSLMGQQIQQPQYINPVVGANQQFSGAVGQRGQDIDYQIAQQQAQAAQQSALYEALGSAMPSFGFTKEL